MCRQLLNQLMLLLQCALHLVHLLSQLEHFILDLTRLQIHLVLSITPHHIHIHLLLCELLICLSHCPLEVVCFSLCLLNRVIRGLLAVSEDHPYLGAVFVG